MNYYVIVQKTANAYGTVTSDIVGIAENKEIADAAIKKFQPIIDVIKTVGGVKVESTLEIQEVPLLNMSEL